jgi:hypothetical protein
MPQAIQPSILAGVIDFISWMYTAWRTMAEDGLIEEVGLL